MVKNKLLIIIAVLLLLFLVFLFYRIDFNKNNTLNIGYNDSISNLDLYSSTSRNVLNMGYLIWDPIVVRDPYSGSILPHLAESWTVLDPTLWEFKLVADIKFHNGNPLDSEAVRYTVMDRILGKEDSPRKVNFQWIKSINIIDELTFQVETYEPYPLVLERFNTLFPYDPVETRDKDDRYISLNPIGTGPYILKVFEEGIRIGLEANPYYWKEGIPKITELNIWFVSDSATRLKKLMEGKLDVAINLNPADLEILEEAEGLAYMNIPVLRISFWQFDSLGRAGETPLVEKKVRQAILYAINRSEIIENKLANQAGLLVTPVHPLQFGYEAGVGTFPYNPDKARVLLTEAGYPDGFTIDLWEYFDEQHLFNIEAIEYLNKVGIEVVLHDYRDKNSELIKLRNNGDVKGIGNYTWGSYNIFDADAILPDWFLLDADKNYTGNKELDSLLSEARFMVGYYQRKKLYSEANSIILNEAYWMPCFIVHRLYGKKKNIQLTVGVDEVPRFQNAYYIKN